MVTCAPHDLHWTRPCVASIRHFYPDIDLYLLKDLRQGDFCTAEIEEFFQVKILTPAQSRFGWGFGKLEAWFSDLPDHFLVMDNDVLFVGPVLSRFQAIPAERVDCIVSPEKQPPEHFRNLYYHPEALRDIDPKFEPPGWGFNTGQILTRAGLLKREDFAGLIDWEHGVRVCRPDVFACADQGVMNYLLQKRSARQEIKLACVPFMYWGFSPDPLVLDMGALKQGRGPALVLHWAGAKDGFLRRFPHAHVIRFFESEYYRRIPRGRWKQLARSARLTLRGG